MHPHRSGEDVIPEICDLSLVSEAVTVSDAESFFAARELLAQPVTVSSSNEPPAVTTAR